MAFRYIRTRIFQRERTSIAVDEYIFDYQTARSSPATTGAMNLEQYFESVEHSVRAVSMLVSASFEGMPFEDLDSNVERTRNLFGRIAHNTNGVLTYYFRIDPEISENVKGFWYVYKAGEGFIEHEVTDITQYDTSDTSALV